MTETTGAPADNASVIGQMLGALAARDFSTARRLWRDDAVWHLQGSHDLAGDHPIDAYLALLQRWFEDHPSYTAEPEALRSDGEQGVALHLRSRGGRAPGVASGWMLYRVEDGVIAEGWGIPTFAGGRYPF